MKKTIINALILSASILCLSGCKKDILLEKTSQNQSSDNDSNEPPKESTGNDNKEEEEDNNQTQTEESEINRKLTNGVLQGAKEINVREFNIQANKADSIYNSFVRSNPMLFHLKVVGNTGYRVDLDNHEYIAAYIPQYSIPPASLQNIYQPLEEAIYEYCSCLDRRMTEQEMAYTLYQKLCKEVVYGERNEEHPELAYGSFSAYGAFMTHKAVCQGYSLSYSLLLNGLGIRTDYITGSIPGTTGHAWNRINIDGEWYNADATFDDASSNNQTSMSSINKYFLSSDHLFYTAFEHPKPRPNLHKEAYDKSGNKFDDEKCVVRRFDSKGKIIKTEAMYANGFWYYISLKDNKMKIIKSDFSGEHQTVIRQLDTPSATGNLDKIKYTEERVFFIDIIDGKYYICSTDYNGNDFIKEKQISFIEAVSADLELTNDKSIPSHAFGGIIELKSELLLAKLKLLYYHGNEDYFNLEHPQAKEMEETIKNAEIFLKNNGTDNPQAKILANQLKEKRKAYSQPISIVP